MRDFVMAEFVMGGFVMGGMKLDGAERGKRLGGWWGGERKGYWEMVWWKRIMDALLLDEVDRVETLSSFYNLDGNEFQAFSLASPHL